MKQLTSAALALAAIAGSTHAQLMGDPDGLEGEYTLDPSAKSNVYHTILGGIPKYNELSGSSGEVHFGASRYHFSGNANAVGDFNGDGFQDIVITAMRGINEDDPGNAFHAKNLDAGKVYIIYGDDTSDTSRAPIDTDFLRLGAASDGDNSSSSTVVHPAFQTNPPSDTSTKVHSDTWYNLFDVEGELRLDSDGGDITDTSDPDYKPRIPGAVLFGEHGKINLSLTGRNYFKYDVANDAWLTSHIDDIYSMVKGTLAGGLRGFYVGTDFAANYTPTTPAANPNFVNTSSGDLTGWSIANAGDVNADGYDDLLIGAPLYSRMTYNVYADTTEIGGGSGEILASPNEAGCVYLIFGSPTKLSGNLQLADVGRNDIQGDPIIDGVKFIGSNVHIKLGQDVRTASSLEKHTNGKGSMLDFNGDNIADFVIGAQTLDTYDVYKEVWDPVDGTINDPDGDGDDSDALDIGHNTSADPQGRDNGNGGCFIIYGEKYDPTSPKQTNSRTPWTNYNDDSEPGNTYYIPSLDTDPTYDNDDGDLDYACLYGHQIWGYLGYAAFAGDFNNDGRSDIVLGAPNFDDANTIHGIQQDLGQAYIIFGAGNRNGGTEFGDELTGNHLVRDLVGAEIPNSDHGHSSNKVRAIAITGEYNTPGDYSSAPPTPLGGPFPEEYSSGATLGWSVMAAGDVDNDGYTDVLLGAHDERQPDGAHAGTGKAHLVYGFNPVRYSVSGDYEYTIEDLDDSASSPPAVASGTPGVATFRGVKDGDWTGRFVFCAGDIDEDGYADFLIGAPRASHTVGSTEYEGTGAAYLIYGADRDGSSTELVGDFDLENVGQTGSSGIRGAVFFGDHIRQEYHEDPPFMTQAGIWITGGADLNNDGISDLVISAPKATRIDVDYPDRYDPLNEDRRFDVGLPGMGGVFIVYGGSMQQFMDVDMDGDVDNDDWTIYAHYLGELTMPSPPPISDCRIIDLDNDGDIDTDDLDVIHNVIT